MAGHETRASLSADALPWNTFFTWELWSSFICCTGIFLLVEMPSLRLPDWGECSSPSPHALAGQVLRRQRCLLLLFHPLSLFFQRLPPPSLSSTSFSLICRRRQLAWSPARNNEGYVYPFALLAEWTRTDGNLPRKKSTYPRVLSPRTLFCRYPPR